MALAGRDLELRGLREQDLGPGSPCACLADASERGDSLGCVLARSSERAPEIDRQWFRVRQVGVPIGARIGA
jgi:hypothetical protein